MHYYRQMRGGAVVAWRAHYPKVAGSSPAPATILFIFVTVYTPIRDGPVCFFIL